MILRMKSRLRLAWWPLCMLSFSLQAAEPASAPAPSVNNSNMDGRLFYQLLLGELNVRQGSPGAGFSLLLDAARKTRNSVLFQRAVEIALQSRSGEAALQAAQSWKREIPDASEPNRYILQILLAVNRIEDAGQALSVSIDELPDSEKREAIASIPRVFARVNDKALAANAVEKALSSSLKDKSLQPTAWTTIGRMRRDAQQLPAAIDAAKNAHASDPKAQGPLILALSLLPRPLALRAAERRPCAVFALLHTSAPADPAAPFSACASGGPRHEPGPGTAQRPGRRHDFAGHRAPDGE